MSDTQTNKSTTKGSALSWFAAASLSVACGFMIAAAQKSTASTTSSMVSAPITIQTAQPPGAIRYLQVLDQAGRITIQCKTRGPVEEHGRFVTWKDLNGSPYTTTLDVLVLPKPPKVDPNYEPLLRIKE